MSFKVDKKFCLMLFWESFEVFILVLPDSFDEIARTSDIESTISIACHDVDTGKKISVWHRRFLMKGSELHLDTVSSTVWLPLSFRCRTEFLGEDKSLFKEIIVLFWGKKRNWSFTWIPCQARYDGIARYDKHRHWEVSHVAIPQT